ncbi:MAG TPA: PAAR domain-containing protein [Blastocatellia bacterium]
MSYLDSLSSAVDKKLNDIKGSGVSNSAQGAPSRPAQNAPTPRGEAPSRTSRFGNQHFVDVMGAFNQAGNAWSNINAPVGESQRPPTDAEKSARTLRATQQTVDALMAAINAPQDMLNLGFANLTAPLAAIWPSMPAATLLSLYIGLPHAHAHPPSACPVPVPLPSLGPVLLGTCVQVLINYLPAARAGDIGWAPTCGGFAPWFEIKTGSSNVFIGGSRAARMTDICMACFPATNPRAQVAGKIMSRVGSLAGMLEKGIEIGGFVAGGLGVAADIAEASVEDDKAMKSALALSAAMGAAQIAADVAAMALSRAMGTDPGIPPSVGAIVIGHPNVLIGGFPMVNFPNPIDVILRRLKRYKGKSPDRHSDSAGCGSCSG